MKKIEGPTEWLSPLVVVPKPNNDLRICVDMREANTVVLRERFPLPNIDQTLEEMNGAKIFSKLDLTQGYHRIPLETSSRDITNFVTYDGIYRYCRLNFGISGDKKFIKESSSKQYKTLTDAKTYQMTLSSSQGHRKNMIRSYKKCCRD